jgi:hypothetical protein
VLFKEVEIVIERDKGDDDEGEEENDGGGDDDDDDDEDGGDDENDGSIVDNECVLLDWLGNEREKIR